MTQINRHRARFAPHLEVLEAREVPAVQLLATGNTLQIIGDARANVINVLDNGQGTISVDVGNEQFTASGIHNVDILTRGGADQVNYQLTGVLRTTENISVSFGNGADTGDFDFSAGIGSSGNLTMVVHDGTGGDKNTVTMGRIAVDGTALIDVEGLNALDTTYVQAPNRINGALDLNI